MYPTHGAGSFCAAPAVAERTTTIGRERAWNPLAQAQSEEEFVKLALHGLPSYPHYFRELRAINQRGPRVLGGLPVLPPLPPAAVHDWMARGGAVLDARPARAFAEGYIPGSYGIALEAPLITWAGWLIPFGAPLVVVTEGPAEHEEAIRQLIRIGYDDLRGYLDDGLAAWEAAGLPVGRIRKIGKTPGTKSNEDWPARCKAKPVTTQPIALGGRRRHVRDPHRATASLKTVAAQ